MTWAPAVLRAVSAETAQAVRLVLDVDGWPGHVAGQHVDVRLTAEDGYTASRSYSIASAPEQPLVELVVQRIEDGEVSPFLSQQVRAGDALELRGPVGGHFIWRSELGGPVELVAGGSGVVPFLAMLEHHRLAGSQAKMRLLYAVRGPQDVLGARVLAQTGPDVQVTYAFSQNAPAGWSGHTGRLDRAALQQHVLDPTSSPQLFVCGPTGFVETVSTALVELGHPPWTVKTERFGDTR